MEFSSIVILGFEDIGSAGWRTPCNAQNYLLCRAMMDGVNPVEAAAVDSPYPALLRAVLLIPFSHYVLGLLILLTVFLYIFLEMHFLEDLFTGFRGQPILLTFNPASQLYHEVVSKCKIFRARYGDSVINWKFFCYFLEFISWQLCGFDNESEATS